MGNLMPKYLLVTFGNELLLIFFTMNMYSCNIFNVFLYFHVLTFDPNLGVHYLPIAAGATIPGQRAFFC